IGNMIPIFFVLFLFKYVEKFLRRFKVFDVFFDKLFARTIAKSKSVEEFQELGLAFFVAIPLPVTGAWTGSLIAYLLKLSYLKSIFFIFLGVVCAGAIVSVITYFKMTGLIIALSVLVIITLFGALKTYLNRKKDNGKVSS
ncbi:MAG TPA: small multi-drug export protein, partial [Spirochaetota bacterium]|nr:small multi-drug export protein [Spirochaetota bacterium]